MIQLQCSFESFHRKLQWFIPILKSCRTRRQDTSFRCALETPCSHSSPPWQALPPPLGWGLLIYWDVELHLPWKADSSAPYPAAPVPAYLLRPQLAGKNASRPQCSEVQGLHNCHYLSQQDLLPNHSGRSENFCPKALTGTPGWGAASAVLSLAGTDDDICNHLVVKYKMSAPDKAYFQNISRCSSVRYSWQAMSPLSPLH